MIIRVIILFLLVTVAGTMALYLSLQLVPNDNALAIGDRATIDLLEIPIVAPIKLDFKTKIEILTLRRNAVGQ